MDGTVRISQMGNGQTPDGDPIFKADLSVVPGKDAEGILAMLGNDELVNSKYAKSRLWFSDLKVKGGMSVRFLANSNIDDGFYLQSGTDGKPLFEVIINFKEMVGMPFIPDELEKGATEFYE